jgi:transposase
MQFACLLSLVQLGFYDINLLYCDNCAEMAPRLSTAQHDLIRGMILSGEPTKDIAKAARCSERGIRRIQRNMLCYDDTKAPFISIGRRRVMTQVMLEALRTHLRAQPGLYQDEIARLLRREFDIAVSQASISRALKSMRWSKKTVRQVAQEQNADLQDYYLHKVSQFRSYQLVFIDESGCDKRIGTRRTGWSPVGTTPVQVTRFHRDKRRQILAAYTQEGIMLSRVYQGGTDSALFEDFIQQLLEHCGTGSEQRSVLVMDNGSIHRTARVRTLCEEAGVALLYLSPYSPRFNPIEEFFAELKAFIRKNWGVYQEAPEQRFDVFLEWCIDIVGARQDSARGHFRHAGITVEGLRPGADVP